ncbi:MipA/OmpV family protein [Cupriavidus sp. CV2]|uniref:MipA/OmpV family protein n=1 Tax=Cupriavidus ulmosensis TaxID=3065913 RepID=UPI00296B0880|nr:MipA/OmpV family protein [Cupriavidus sp. CV2]MDW3683563.1 MipA/OmpV family protein [Cupriavidus sp. CV2]
MTFIRKTAVVLSAGCLLTGWRGASAQPVPDPAREQSPEWSITVGAGVGVAPAYLGAKDMRVLPVPVVTVQHGPFYVDAIRGLGYRYETGFGLFFGQALTYDLGRSDRRSDYQPGSKRLAGMGSIGAAAVTTAEIGYGFAPWLAVRAEGAFALSGRERGNRYRVGLEGALWSSAKDDVWYELDAHFSDRRYASTYFGVTSAQSTASGFSRYAPARGFYATSLSLNWEHRFTRHWSTLLSINAVNLAGDAGRSPIVQERLNWYGLAAINYRF